MEERIVIFGISGQKRAGKDTIADYIKGQVISSRVSFAEPVRDVCRAYFGWDDDWLLGKHKEDVDPYWGISPRQAMQYLGTEVGRVGLAENYPEFKSVTDDNIWIKKALQTIRNKSSDEYINKFGKIRAFIIPDMRFLNEYSAIKKMVNEGFEVITIGVRREGLPSDSHASETEIRYCVDKCDFILANNRKISDLEDSVDEIITESGVERKPDWMIATDVERQLEMDLDGGSSGPYVDLENYTLVDNKLTLEDFEKNHGKKRLGDYA